MTLTRQKDDEEMNMKKKELKMNIKKVTKKTLKTVKSDQDNPVLTAPYIDKMSVVVNMPDEKLHGQFIHELLSFIETKEPGVIQFDGTDHFPIAVCLYYPGKGFAGSGGIRVESTYKLDKNPRVRITFNPDKFFGPLNSVLPLNADEDVIDWLNITFQGLWGGGFFEFLAHGKVTYLEVWRHILNRQPDDYLFRARFSQTAQNVFGKSGKLETLYFGKRESRQTIVYNKAKEMGKGAGHDVIRVEVRLRPKGLSVQKLWELENPFGNLEIVSLKEPDTKFWPSFWVLFKEACRYRGVAGAIKLLPKNMKAKIEQVMKQNAVSFWDIAEDDWNRLWPQALQYAYLDNVPDQASPLNFKVQTGC